MSETKEPNLTDQQSSWLSKLKACEASGKSMKAFSVAEGLALKDLYSWKKTLVKKGVLPRTRTPRFQRTQITGAGNAGHECQIVLPNGVTVMLSGGLDGVAIKNLLHHAMQL